MPTVMSKPVAHEAVETVTYGGVTVDLLEWRDYSGITDPRTLELIAMLRLARLPLRQVRLSLNQQSSAVLEAGVLQLSNGTFDIDNSIPFGGGVRRLFGSMVSGVKLFRPRYSGLGQLWLQPSFQNYLVLSLDHETIIVENGMFVCCDGAVDVATKMQSTVSSMLFGGEGMFQTKLSGSGFVVLASPVASSEILRLDVKPGHKIQVEGHSTLLRTSGVRFSMGKSARTWFGTATSGEGLMHTFEGTGQVWVAPTAPIYENLATLVDPATMAAEAVAAANALPVQGRTKG